MRQFYLRFTNGTTVEIERLHDILQTLDLKKWQFTTNLHFTGSKIRLQDIAQKHSNISDFVFSISWNMTQSVYIYISL